MSNTVKKVRKSTAPFYGAAAVWVVYALVFDLYRWNHFVFAALLSGGAFLLLRSVCKDEVTETVVPDPPKEEEKPTGNAELDKMIDDGKKAVAEMKRLDDAIADEAISADIRRLEAVCVNDVRPSLYHPLSSRLYRSLSYPDMMAGPLWAFNASRSSTWSSSVISWRYCFRLCLVDNK